MSRCTNKLSGDYRKKPKSKKDRKHNGQRKKLKDKRKNDDLQNTTQKIKDRATPIRLKTKGELSCSGSVSRSCSTCDTPRLSW